MRQTPKNNQQLTVILSNKAVFPITVYLLSALEQMCSLTQEVFPEPGNPHIKITYKVTD